MSNVEIVLVGSIVFTIIASVGYCWFHFKKYVSSHDEAQPEST